MYYVGRPDLSSRSVRLKLKPLYGRRRLVPFVKPYWNLLAYGRHLGYVRKTATDTWWVARYRTKPGSGYYHQHRLGRTDDRQKANGRDILNYEQAATRAWSWFTGEANSTGNTRARDSLLELSYCPVGEVYTVAHALNDWVAWTRMALSHTYVSSNIAKINFHILPRLGTLAVDDFSGDDFRKFVLDIIESPTRREQRKHARRVPMEQLDFETLRKRKRSANSLIGMLRMSFQMAWENGKTKNDRSWRAVHYLRNYQSPRELFLTRSECRTLLSHCEPDLKLLVLGALYTGCRVTELLRLQAKDVGRGGYGVAINFTKNYRPRFVFLPDEGMNFFLNLAKRKDPQDFLFVRSEGPWRKNYRYYFAKAIRSANLPAGFCFHGLRHTYASQLVQAGAPLKMVADQLGHKSATTVSETYGHLAPQIRESEVRQRFTELSPENAKKAARQKKALMNWRNSLQGSHWRTYAVISDLSSRQSEERAIKMFMAYSQTSPPVHASVPVKLRRWRYGPSSGNA